MVNHSSRMTDSAAKHRGPHLGVLAIVFTALFNAAFILSSRFPPTPRTFRALGNPRRSSRPIFKDCLILF
jgi:hypothetical protein